MFKITSTILATTLLLQGCITSLVTVPVKVAYGVTKTAVKGTVAVVEAVIPDADKNDKENKNN